MLACPGAWGWMVGYSDSGRVGHPPRPTWDWMAGCPTSTPTTGREGESLIPHREAASRRPFPLAPPPPGASSLGAGRDRGPHPPRKSSEIQAQSVGCAGAEDAPFPYDPGVGDRRYRLPRAARSGGRGGPDRADREPVSRSDHLALRGGRGARRGRERVVQRGLAARRGRRGAARRAGRGLRGGWARADLHQPRVPPAPDGLRRGSPPRQPPAAPALPAALRRGHEPAGLPPGPANRSTSWCPACCALRPIRT
jgi:hypothetical protein